jgi:hypothetical protein
MSEQPEQVLPDTVVALGPDTLPNRPLCARDVPGLIKKEIG